MKTQLKHPPLHFKLIIVALFQMVWFQALSYNVTQLKATYRDGQVCIAWNSPEATNLKYNIYRSKTQFVSSAQFSPENYLGSVRDSSSKNIRRSRLNQSPVYFKWDPAGSHFSSYVGIYVVTCTEEASFYYAVTVTDLATEVEDLYLKVNKNVTYFSVAEHIADTQPVLQDTVVWGSGDTAYMYTFFGNNQNASTQPAFNNCGSYGYNFYLIKRGNVSSDVPVYVVYEGLGSNSLVGNGLDAFAAVTDCYIMGMDDWTPYPDGYGTDAGKSTSWIGYHENYDMYSADNPVPTSGIVKAYTQTRLIHTINWGRKFLANADSNRVYLIGVSAGGFGVLVTANLIPDKIAAVYSIAFPTMLQSGDGTHEPMWGSSTDNLTTDLINPITKLPMKIFDAMNSKYLLINNINNSLPMIYSVHGKKDNTIGWKDKPGYFDTLQLSLHGGVMFWDQRDHDGSNQLFLDSETMPDFNSFSINQSYPAFGNCTIDQNPGNGKKNNGDSYGAINGYLGYDNVNDDACDYSLHLFIKNINVGGILGAEQYDTCNTDITLRRIQRFSPQDGDYVSWNNTSSDGNLLQSGSFIFNSATPISLNGIKMSKSGNTLDLRYGTCAQKIANPAGKRNFNIQYIRTTTGWEAHLNSSGSEVVSLAVYNTVGQMLEHRTINLQAGENIIEVGLDHHAIYLIEILGSIHSNVTKLAY